MYDFYSDGKTIPSRAMRESILEAEVGDEARGEDPTTLRLLSRVAELTGKEDAIFMTSGTMCNEVSLYTLCPRGDVLMCERTSHIINFEAGAPAALTGAQIQAIDGERGMIMPEQIDEALKITAKANHHRAKAAILTLEQTTNLGGGGVWPLEQMHSVVDRAKSHGMKTYLDGARMFNACAKTGITAQRYCEPFDVVMVDFTKGLGCPFGAVVAGSKNFIGQVWRTRQMFGGGMRQSGIMAAMANYALDNNIYRLVDDNELAAFVGSRLRALPTVARVMPVDTNIVIFDIEPGGPTAVELVDFARAAGFRIGAFGERTIRLVTHMNVDLVGAKELVAVIEEGLRAAHRR